MSNGNRISLVIPDEVVAAAKQHFTDGAQLLAPYLISLLPEEIKVIPKMGDKSYPFVMKSLEYLRNSETTFPAYLNVEELAVDLKSYDTIRQILQTIMPTVDQLEDTMILSGSEAYVAALAFYNYIKGAARLNMPGAQTILDDLSPRFVGRPSRKSEQP